MSHFLKPVDYNDDNDDDDDDDGSCLIRARPIDSNIARKLGNYASSKDFVTGSMESQQELRENNTTMENDPKRDEMMEEKIKLEQRNKLGAKILKAKLQGKICLVKKLEKELYALREDRQGSTSICKVLLRTDGGDVRIPATMKQEKKDLKIFGTVDAIYHTEKNIHDMLADEKETTSSHYIFNNIKTAKKHRADEDWVVDDAMMAVKRTRKREEKEKRRSRSNLIKDKFVFALLAITVRIFGIPGAEQSTNVTGKDSIIVIIILSCST
ncbi:CWF19-like protein [Dirofilaria immitis]